MNNKAIDKDALDDIEFMELMQAFRDAPRSTNMIRHMVVVEKCEAVKEYIRRNIKNIRRV